MKEVSQFRKALLDINHRNATAGSSSIATAFAAVHNQVNNMAPPYSSTEDSQNIQKITSAVVHIEKLLESIESKTNPYTKLKSQEQ